VDLLLDTVFDEQANRLSRPQWAKKGKKRLTPA